MTRRIEYWPEARADVREIYQYYESCSSGLGERFAEALQLAVHRVGSAPELSGIFRGDIRAAVLRTFPYVIYYQIADERIGIVAVQHGRRSETSWQDRVR